MLAHQRLSRRSLLSAGALAAWAVCRMEVVKAMEMRKSAAHFLTRGIVLTPDDLTLSDWPERAARAGLTTLALHPTTSVVAKFVASRAGKGFLQRCRELGMAVEYELHAMSELLPRDLFPEKPEMFRMDADGNRVREGNLCVHSEDALEHVAARAVEIARRLRPTTGRYFLWGDDGAPWCRCPECRDLSDSDQALLLANHLARVLRAFDRRATVAHLAYHNTLAAPTQVRPERNVFLEFAPIHRRYDVPFEQQSGPDARDTLAALDANLRVFDPTTAQILEYWLDLSRFAGWKRPAPRLPWSAPMMAADLDAYGARGIRHATSFGVFLDAEYVRDHGQPPIDEYARLLSGWRPARRVSLGGKTEGTAASPEPAPTHDSLADPYRERLLGTGSRLPALMEACAEPLHGEPAFDPAHIWRIAAALRLPGLSSDPVAREADRYRRLLEWSVRVGIAHIEATFRGDHPRYGVGAYAAAEHDGFPPTILAAADALSQWGMVERAQELVAYWLRTFVGDDGAIRYYGPSLSEYGQLLTMIRSLIERGARADWLSRCVKPVAALAQRVSDLTGSAARPSLASGAPEADTAADRATYFHNNAWLWRGLSDWSWIADKRLGLRREAEGVRARAVRLRLVLIRAIRDTWPRDRDDWWLRPMAEPESPGNFARPLGRVTASRLGSYTNYRYWPELLSSGALPEDLMRRVVEARLKGGGQWLGMTRFEDHLDDWPLNHYLEGLWALGMRAEYRYVLWGHLLYHQARGHLTAYEQVSLPPGRKVADYCLPGQLVVARAARRVV